MGVKIDMSDLNIDGDAKILNDAKISNKSKVDINIEKANVKGDAEVLNELNAGKESEVKVKIKDTTIDGNARTLNNIDATDGKLQVEVENFKTGNNVEFMNDKKINADKEEKINVTAEITKKENDIENVNDKPVIENKVEVDLIKLLSDNVKNLEENKNNKVQEMIKEQKLDLGIEILNKRKEEALAEIEKHDVTEMEAKSDLEKIEIELEKIKDAEESIEKNVANEIKLAKKTLTEVNKLVDERVTVEIEIKKEQEVIRKLEKNKQEALQEIKENESKEASNDLEKIERELAEKSNKLAEKNERLDKLNKKLSKLVSKNMLDKEKIKDTEQKEESKPQNNKEQRIEPLKQTDNDIQKVNISKPQNNNLQKIETVEQSDNNDQEQGNKGKIIGIEILEGSDKINIAKVGEDGQIQNLTIENKLKEILKNKKEIFKNPEVAKIIEEVEPSRFKRHFLKRKLSPVILNVLSENKQGLSIIDYVVAIKKEENCESLKIKHDLSNTVLKGRLKRMMKRVAKTEHSIDGMEVKGLKERKTMGLLESGKRKLKNKPATIKEGIKFVGKTLGREAKKGFRQVMKVPKNIKNKLATVAEKYQDEDLEKLEDKEDPDLEESQQKAQNEEEQEK